MIRRVTVRRFKRFEEERFELPGSVILAGANNSGKSTLLQAIATWRFGLDRWIRERQPREARKSAGVAVPRAEFAAAPVHEMISTFSPAR